jgi:hypothetical protein
MPNENKSILIDQCNACTLVRVSTNHNHNDNTIYLPLQSFPLKTG